MLPIPIMSTETLASCAEIGQTRAAKTSAPAGATGLRHYILLLARFASQQEGTFQVAKDERREPLSEFAWSLGISWCDNLQVKPEIWFPNLVTVGQKVDQIRPDWSR